MKEDGGEEVSRFLKENVSQILSNFYSLTEVAGYSIETLSLEKKERIVRALGEGKIALEAGLDRRQAQKD